MITADELLDAFDLLNDVCLRGYQSKQTSPLEREFVLMDIAYVLRNSAKKTAAVEHLRIFFARYHQPRQ